jgi:hypothetical protein
MYGRPYTVFDAKNKDHRKWFADFNKTGAWGRCPVRFVVLDDHGDLITQIQRELIQYYVDREFGTASDPKVRSVQTKQSDSVNQNILNLVDTMARMPYNTNNAANNSVQS